MRDTDQHLRVVSPASSSGFPCYRRIEVEVTTVALPTDTLTLPELPACFFPAA